LSAISKQRGIFKKIIVILMPGKLYLIPSLLGDSAPEEVLPQAVFEIIKRIDCYIAEDIRTARRFLKKAVTKVEIDNLRFFELNKYTPDEDLAGYLQPAVAGKDMGLLSDAGAPCIADPGSKITMLAHRTGIPVVPLVGPTSIMLALMASGLNGQFFTFHGYLPVKKAERIKAIKRIEKESINKRQSQIFMETPYRNAAMLEDLTRVCNPSTLLCVACDITLGSEFISTREIADWAKKKPDIHKRPAIFILQGYSSFATSSTSSRSKTRGV
jgi:16S rRNA (cytidine1402-2'-O)-methyltransferase